MAKKMMKKAAKASSSNGKSAPAKKPGRVTPASKVRSLGDLCRTISEHVGVKAKEVKGVFETLGAVMAADLNKGPGVFKVGNLMKVTVVRKPATKEREGTNPFTGEKMTFKAKPARNVVKVRPLKSLKAMV